VKGIAREGKIVLRAHMVRKGDTATSTKRARAMRMYVRAFIV
jgi:hypothetical protein